MSDTYVPGGFVENAAENNVNAPEQDLVERARRMGWRSKEEFRGPSDKWVEPEEYVRRGEEVIPIIRSQLQREQERVALLERARVDHERKIEERLKQQDEAWTRRLDEQRLEYDSRAEGTARAAQLAIQRQRDRYMAELDAAKRAAVPEEHRSKYDELIQREQEFYKTVAQEEEQLREYSQPRRPAPPVEQERRQEPPGSQQGRQLSQDDMAVINDWRHNNPWFDTKIDATRIANMLHVNLLEERPNLSLRENLAEVTAEMQRRFPEKIGYNPTRERQDFQSAQNAEFHNGGQTNDAPRHSPVEGGQSYSAPAANNPRLKKGWNQINADDRRLFETTVFPTGIYGKDIAKARDQWASDYLGEYPEG
jgi:hypothetical protein